MPTIDLETAIANFLTLGRRLQATQPLIAQQVLDEVSTWYLKYRVEGADLEDDADMLLLQWGATRPLVVTEPTDLRGLDDDDLKFAEQELKYLDFTRQIFSGDGDGDDDDEIDHDEFDDAAVQMSIKLGYAPAEGSEPNSNCWISSPDKVAASTKKFLREPFVQSLIAVPVQTVAVTVGYCG